MHEARIDSLRRQHSKLNDEIDRNEKLDIIDQQHVKQLKKKRLSLRDEIQKLTKKQGK